MEKPEQLSDKTEPKSGPPSLSEWQDFFARFVIRLLVEGYLALVLGDVFDELSPQEADLIKLSKEDMARMGAPLATVANSSKFARKHGRTIIAFADTYESVLEIFFWMHRVNKIARKHKRARQPKNQTRVITPEQFYPPEGNPNVQPDGSNSSEVNGVERPVFDVWNPGSG